MNSGGMRRILDVRIKKKLHSKGEKDVTIFMVQTKRVAVLCRGLVFVDCSEGAYARGIIHKH